MEKYRVLIVDDSEVSRKVLKTVLEHDPRIEVVGLAGNGQDAIAMASLLKPHVITMDLRMEGMDGFAAIAEIMYRHPTPILVVTSANYQEQPFIEFEAFTLGALDIIQKPTLYDQEDLGKKVIDKIKVLSGITLKQRLPKKMEILAGAWEKALPRQIVAIGSSAGGCQALREIFSRFPRKLECAIVVAQHISAGFVAGLAEWLSRDCSMVVREASSGDILKSGEILLAPAEYDLEIEKGYSVKIVKSEEPGPKPSVDKLFSSVAKVYGKNSVGVILTGMGNDGTAGCQAIKNAGGYTIAEAEEDCMVYGMPKAAVEAGMIKKVVRLQDIPQEILSRIEMIKHDPPEKI